MGNSEPVWLAKSLTHRNYPVESGGKPVKTNQATSLKCKLRILLKGSNVFKGALKSCPLSLMTQVYQQYPFTSLIDWKNVIYFLAKIDY